MGLRSGLFEIEKKKKLQEINISIGFNWFSRYIYIYNVYYITTAMTSVLPGEMRFDCAGPVFYEIRDVGHLPQWLTRVALIIVVIIIIRHETPSTP